MSVIYGNEFQPSLRDLADSRSAPNAEALGYCRPVPPGRDPRRVSNWIQPGTGKTNASLVSPQRGYSFVTHPATGADIEESCLSQVTCYAYHFSIQTPVATLG